MPLDMGLWFAGELLRGPGMEARGSPDRLDAAEQERVQAYGVAARLALAFTVLALALGAAGTSGRDSAPGQAAPAVRPNSTNAPAQPSLTPFSDATWSESIGR